MEISRFAARARRGVNVQNEIRFEVYAKTRSNSFTMTRKISICTRQPQFLLPIPYSLLPNPYCLIPNPYSLDISLTNQKLSFSPPYAHPRSLIPRKDFVIKRIGTKINGTNKRKKGGCVEKSEFGFR